MVLFMASILDRLMPVSAVFVSSHIFVKQSVTVYGGIQERGDVELPSNTLFTNTEIAGDRYTHRE